VFVGVLAQGPALAVGLGLVWSLVLENLLRGLSGLIAGMSTVTDHLPGTAAGSLAGSLGATGIRADGNGTPGVLTALSGTTAAWLLVAYLLAFTVAATVLIRRRDLT
jgi:ABC-2 type transport system permease protein